MIDWLIYRYGREGCISLWEHDACMYVALSFLEPRPHQQQCRSNRQHCRSYVRLCWSNIRLCCHKRQLCRTSIVKFRPFSKVETNWTFNLFRLCRKDEISFDIVAETGNNVEETLDFVERIDKLVAFDNVAWTLLLVWTGLWLHDNAGSCVACVKQADIGIILDHSTSIVSTARGGYHNWDVSLKGFLTQLIDSFSIGPTLIRIGMVGFSTSAWLQFGFSAYNNSRTMTAAVNDMDIRTGETNIAQVCWHRSSPPCAIFIG